MVNSLKKALKRSFLCFTILAFVLVGGLSVSKTSYLVADVADAVVVASGNCGADTKESAQISDPSEAKNNLTFEISGETGNYTLTINGSGYMANFKEEPGLEDIEYRTPWHGFSTDIKHITISSEVSSIGTNAFADFTNLQDVTILSSDIIVDESAFYAVGLYNPCVLSFVEQTGTTNDMPTTDKEEWKGGTFYVPQLHEHTFENFRTTENSMICICSYKYCSLENNELVLTISIDSQTHVATISNSEVLEALTGMSLTVKYVGINDTEYADSTEVPTAPGEYKAYFQLEGISGQELVEISSSVTAEKLNGMSKLTLTDAKAYLENINAQNKFLVYSFESDTVSYTDGAAEDTSGTSETLADFKNTLAQAASTGVAYFYLTDVANATKTMSANFTICGHLFDEPTYIWSTDNLQCTASMVCTLCGKTETETAHATATVTQAKDCTNDEFSKYTVTFVGTGFTQQEKTNVKTADRLGHTPVVDSAVAATCTDTGLTEGSHCSVCEATLVEQTATPMLAHEYGEPSYEWSAGNHQCTASKGCLHCEYVAQETATAQKEISQEKTCTTNEIANFTATFVDTAYSAQTLENITTAAAGHQIVIDEVILPTCTQNGLSSGTHCSVCGEIIVPQEEMLKLDHDIIHHEAKDATLDEIGWAEYDTCSRCDYSTYREIPKDTLKIENTTTHVKLEMSDGGAMPGDIDLKITIKNASDVKSLVKLESGMKIASVYSIELLKNNGGGTLLAVQPSDFAESSKVKITLTVPEGVKVKNLQYIAHIHDKNNIDKITDFVVNSDGTITFEVDSLSDFVFVQKTETNWWVIVIIIVASIVVVFVLGLVLYLANILKGKFFDGLYGWARKKKATKITETTKTTETKTAETTATETKTTK